MKRFITLALLVAAMSIVGVAQTSMTPQMQNAPARKSPLAGYAGAWIGMFEGHAWMSVRLNMQGDLLTGSVQRAHEFQFNNNGGLKSVSDDKITESVDKAVVQGDGLLLTVKDPNTQQTSSYVMRLTSADTAELKVVAMSMPPGMPKPQPFKLSKVTANAVTPAR
jgi:hypothetical protein